MIADSSPPAFEGWAILELLGHRKLAGRVSQEIQFGVPMCRIDVPSIGEIAGFTQWYGGGSIYAMTPVSEQIAMGVAAGLKARAVSVFDLPRAMRDPQAKLAFRAEVEEDNGDDPF